MKEISSEALYEDPFFINEIAISNKDAEGNYTVTMRQQKRGQQLHESKMKFTQNGMNALVGSWMMQTGNIPDDWK